MKKKNGNERLLYTQISLSWFWPDRLYAGDPTGKGSVRYFDDPDAAIKTMMKVMVEMRINGGKSNTEWGTDGVWHDVYVGRTDNGEKIVFMLSASLAVIKDS